MSGATSTSPISMRAAANNQKKQRGLFKGWKKNSKLAAAEDDTTNNNRVAIDPQQQQIGNSNNWYDDPRQKSPNRRYQTRAAPQFSPSNNHSYHVNGNKQQSQISQQKINQNYPTNDEYYGYCNDELSRQLHLAAQKDRHTNEERVRAKMKFRKEHCVPYTRNQLAPPSPTQLEHIYQQQQVVKQQIAQQQGGMKIKLPQGQVTGRDLSRRKEDVLTQSTQTTKDTSSEASSLTNTTNGGNVGGQSNGGKVTPVTNALSTAARVFEQQTSDYTSAAGGGGDKEEYVQDWTPMSDSFIQQPDTSGDDFNFKMNTLSRPPQRGNIVGASSWREAVDPNSGKKYYYNVQTKEVSWTIPKERRSRTPPPPPPPPSNEVTSENNATHTAKTPHRNNTTAVHRKQHQQQRQQGNVQSNKSPPRTRASPSLHSIAEDEGNDYDDESDDSDVDDAYVSTSQMHHHHQQQRQQVQHPRTRSKSPFRVISSGQSRSPVRHASSSFHADPNRGDDPDGVGSSTASSGGSSRRSVSPFRVLNKIESVKKKKGKKPVVNRMPSSLRGRGSREAGDVNSLVSHYDDPSIGALSSLDDTTLASRSLSRKSASVAAASSAEEGGGGGSKRRDASETPPRNKKYADPPGESIDEIFQSKVLNRSNGGVQNSSYSRGYHSPHRRERQQQRRLPDPSPMRENQQQHVQHSPYQQHHSPYSAPSPHPQHPHQNRSPYKHNQQQPNLLYMGEQQQHRSPHSGQHHDPPHLEENLHDQQYLQQPQIYVDEDGNQWMLTPQEMSRQPSLQPRGQQQPRQIYYDEDGQPYYYEDEDEYVTEQHYQQQIQQQEQVAPPSQLHAPQQSWQWSEQQGPTPQNRHPTQDGYPAEDYFEDGNGNFISFITPDPDDNDNHILKDFESIGMLTGDEEGPPLDDPNEAADDDTAANTINTVDLVAEVKRVWRHVQRYEQKKSMKADNRIETKESEDEMFVHQFNHAFAQASPGRGNKSIETNTMTAKKRENMTKSGSADDSAMATSNQDPRKDAVQISQEENEVVSNSRGRSHIKDNRLGQHIRSTSLHSRALSSRGESPANGSDYAMMSHGDTEMDGAFISEGMDEFFLSPGKPQKSSLKQAQQKEHLLHPSQVAAAQKLMQNKKAAISAAAAKKSSKVSNGAKHDDLAKPYDFDKVKSTGTNYSQKTQTISNTTTSKTALKALERKNLTNRTRTPPRSPASRNKNVQTQEKGVERNGAMSPGSLYANALKNAKERKIQRERNSTT